MNSTSLPPLTGDNISLAALWILVALLSLMVYHFAFRQL
jgi:hypothetical protein